jgi:hypothetical protein
LAGGSGPGAGRRPPLVATAAAGARNETAAVVSRRGASSRSPIGWHASAPVLRCGLGMGDSPCGKPRLCRDAFGPQLPFQLRARSQAVPLVQLPDQVRGFLV